MPKIELNTIIDSSLDICFDLSTSIDLHKISTAHTGEEAIDGKCSGLITLGESVTWKATHFGVSQKLTSTITKYSRPYHFRDEQTKGIFKSFSHDHSFNAVGGKVLMTDVFRFESPMGIAGRLFNKFILTAYLTRLLTERNNIIKTYAESQLWKTVLPEKDAAILLHETPG